MNTQDEGREHLPSRVLQMQAASHPGDYNCGPHIQVFVLCEDSTMWVQYHASPNSNVPSDGRWYPVTKRHADLREVVRHVRDMIDQLHFVSVEYPHRGCEIMTKDLEMLGNELREALEKA